MSGTYEEDDRKVEIVANDLSIKVDGLEILAAAAATVVELDDTMREVIEEAIVSGGEGPGGSFEWFAAKPIGAALVALAETEDDDLEDPIRAWIRKSPTTTALYRRVLDDNHTTDVIMFGSEVTLQTHMKGVSARLVTGDSVDYAHLIVSKGLAVMICLLRCPMVIKVAYDVAMDC